MQILDKFYIGGQWVSPIADKSLPVVDPSTENTCAELAMGSAKDVDQAVAAAKNAFVSFSRTSVEERIAILERLITVYKKRYDDVAQAISLEMGAPISLAKGSQTHCGLGHLKEALKVLKDYSFKEQTESSLVIKEPIGVCGLITPWNWPINQIVCKVAPAIAVGCTVVLKPSEVAPLSAQVFAEIVAEAQVPKGVFNMVFGDGASVGSAISSHKDIDMVSFTGSTRAGVQVAQSAAPTVKRVAQELGGKSPNIILEDADVKLAVSVTLGEMMCNSGQSCNAPSRMLVPHALLPEIERELVKQVAKLNVGDPKNEETDLGPVVSDIQYMRIRQLIGEGIKDGAKLLCGGLDRPAGLTKGYYITPTIFSEVTPEMTIAREEIFGPVMAVIAYDDIADAIKIANDTVYGLAAYIQGKDKEIIQEVALSLRAGNININGNSGGYDTPFGGYKQSGNGREWGSHGFEDFIEIKAISGI